MIAKLNPSRTQIEVYSLDQDAIDFAIAHAVRSGQVPLKLSGTKAFIKLAEARAVELQIPVANPKFTTKGDQKMYKQPEPVNPVLDRLNKKMDLTNLAIQSGNIRQSELDWRGPKNLKDWLTEELKNNKSANRADLLELAKQDDRIKKEWITELKAERDESETRAQKMRY